MFSEPVRRAAMEAARDRGRATATGKVTLVQEGAQEGQQAGRAAPSGFLLYVPVYRAGAPRESIEQRRAAILGWVYAPFRITDLMRGLGGEQAGDLEVEVYDRAAAEESALLYRSANVRAARTSSACEP